MFMWVILECLVEKPEEVEVCLLSSVFLGKFYLVQTNQKNNGNISCLFFVSTESQLALFRASFETNPLDGKCDQRAEVSSQPVQVIYDAVSINL